MQKANTPQCRIFWFLVIVVSLSLTAISIYQAFCTFINEPTHVTLLRQTNNSILYPPLKICFQHWLTWFNWTASEAMNFTKSEVLFAMSFISLVFTEEHFDEKKVEESFYSKLFANNITSIEQFYVATAYKKMIRIENFPDGVPNYDVFLEDFPKSNKSQMLQYWLCYQFSENQVAVIIERMSLENRDYQSSMDNSVLRLDFESLVIKEFQPPSWLTEYEYSAQLIFCWRGVYDSYLDARYFEASVFPDGYSNNVMKVYAYLESYYAQVSTIAYSWMDSNAAHCRIGRRWIASNNTCYEGCKRKLEIKMRKSVLGRKFTSEVIRTLRNKIVFGNLTGSEIKANWDEPNIFDFGNLNVSEDVQQKAHSHYEMCVKNCNLETGCEIWSHSFTKTENSDSRVSIAIAYPFSVEVMKETNLRTLENFVGDIGGLLGIWTGASVLTIFQVIYLCCWQNGPADLEDFDEN